MEVEYSYKYQPLFELLEGLHPNVDTVIVTGGRGSAKSHAISFWSITALIQHAYNILYTRYTSLSIVDSVKPEVSDKIEFFPGIGIKDTETHIEFRNNRIAFKGIKTGSKQQTANLKSLSGFNVFIVDEAEELPDLDTFKKVFYSIRSPQKRNITILILNPTSQQHWIYEEFFLSRGVEGGHNGIKENVMYIHTSYLDVNPKYIAENIRKDYERLLKTNPDKYNNVVAGGWLEEPEGVLLPKSSLTFADLSTLEPDHAAWRFAVGDPADKGGDKYATPFIYAVQIDGQIKCFVKAALCNKDGIEVNGEHILARCRNLKIDEVFIESNGVGLAAVLLLKKILPHHIQVKAFPSTEDKEVRILSNYEFIRDYFIFDSNYANDEQYSQFLRDLTTYAKEDDNKHKKDAIDVLSTAAKLVKVKFGDLLYN